METGTSRRLSERGYILWSDGGAYTNHKNSKTLHSQCAAPCDPRGGFKEVSDTLWAKYANHVYNAYGGLDNEGRHKRLWAKQERAIPKKYLTQSRGGLLEVMDWTPEQSPVRSASPSRLLTPTRSSSPPNLEEPIWGNILEHSATDDYRKYMKIVCIENTENHMISREAALEMLTFTVPSIDLDGERLREYKTVFPQLVFTHSKTTEQIWFEWVGLYLFFMFRYLVFCS